MKNIIATCFVTLSAKKNRKRYAKYDPLREMNPFVIRYKVACTNPFLKNKAQVVHCLKKSVAKFIKKNPGKCENVKI